MRKDIYIYHFIRIPTEDSWTFVNKVLSFNAVVCFDLEDSIKNPFGSNDRELKIEIRKKILDFIEESGGKLSNKELGIRINSFTSAEFTNDLYFLNDFNKYARISCIFLPKIENAEEIISITKTLKDSQIFYKEIIPVVETISGFSGLPKIICDAGGFFEKLAFGHCDFNLNNNFFPFHHQYSPVYWSWIDNIYSAFQQTPKILINSPFLFLNDDLTFKNSLGILYKKSKSGFGQITLCLRQTQLANEFRYKPVLPTTNYTEFYDRHKEVSAQEIINAFENNKLEKKSFAVVPDDKRLISPQEYLAAKSIALETKIPPIKISVLIVGGCFTQQHNIEPSKLYHQLIQKELRKNHCVDLKIEIVRYERLTKCLEKIKSAVKIQKPDLILFHIRPEPLIKISKLYYRYKDSLGILRGSINIAYLNKLKVENYQHKISPIIDRTYKYPRESFIRRSLIYCNQLLGIATGNLKYALKLYLTLVLELNNYCQKENIQLLSIGPVSRPHTILENKLSEILDSYIEASMVSNKIPYVKCIGTFSNENKSLFGLEGIFVNEQGHKRIADLIYKALINNRLVSYH